MTDFPTILWVSSQQGLHESIMITCDSRGNNSHFADKTETKTLNPTLWLSHNTKVEKSAISDNSWNNGDMEIDNSKLLHNGTESQGKQGVTEKASSAIQNRRWNYQRGEKLVNHNQAKTDGQGQWGKILLLIAAAFWNSQTKLQWLKTRSHPKDRLEQNCTNL